MQKNSSGTNPVPGNIAVRQRVTPKKRIKEQHNKGLKKNKIYRKGQCIYRCIFPMFINKMININDIFYPEKKLIVKNA